ncbi:10209_t:CDS:2, partial [Dentiscutata erythropus]
YIQNIVINIATLWLLFTSVPVRISTSIYNYVDDDDIYFVDVNLSRSNTYSVDMNPPRSDTNSVDVNPPESDESLVYKSTKESKFDICQIYYPEEANSNGPIIKATHVISKRRQKKIAQLLVKFIIEDCQPLHILCSQAFYRLLNYMEVGFHIPCKQTVKKMIDKAYDWSQDQLFEMMNIDGGFVNLITDI